MIAVGGNTEARSDFKHAVTVRAPLRVGMTWQKTEPCLRKDKILGLG
jgi:hypothetical protein